MLQFFIAACSAKTERSVQDNRPHVDALIEGVSTQCLVDTGAALSVISEKFFHLVPARWKCAAVPVSPNLRLSTASGNPLEIVGRFLISLKMLGREITRPFYIVRGLANHTVILGVDFIREQQLVIDSSDVFFKNFVSPQDESLYVLKPLQDTVLQSRTVQPLICSVFTTSGRKVAPGTLVTCYTSGTNIGLVDSFDEINDNGTVRVLVINNTDTNLHLLSEETMGFASLLDKKDLSPVDDEFVASLFGSMHDVPEPNIGPSDAPLSDEDKKYIFANIRIEATSEWTQKYLDLILRYHDTCSKGKFDLGRTGVIKHAIRLKDKNPIHMKQFRIPLEDVQIIHDWVDELIKKGAVELSRSAYNAPIFVVPKPHGGGARVVLDFRALNLASIPDRYHIREVRDCVDEIGKFGSKIFSALDLTSGFWQQELEEESKQFTAFTVPGKGTRYQWTVTPMGLQGSPSSFARLIDYCMRGLKTVICYIDDVLCHSKTHEEHLQTLEKILLRLRKYNLKLNVKKSIFGASSITYLGYQLSGEGVGPGPEKLKAIRDFPMPTSVKKIREALGLTNYFRFLIPGFNKCSSQLSKLLKKDSGYKDGPMPEESQKAFEKLKSALSKAPVVAHPQPGLDFHLRTDASAGDANHPGGFGAVLTQEWPDGKERVISYASRALKPFEKNYSPYLLELAAAAWAIDNFHVYLKGRRFSLYTDHKPLETMSTIHKKTLNRLQQQMLEYDFSVHYLKGSDNGVADALSRSITSIRARSCFPYNLSSESDTLKLIAGLKDQSGSLAEAQQSDSLCSDVLKELKNEFISGPEEYVRKISRIAKNCFLSNGVVFYKLQRKNEPSLTCVLAPKCLQEHILKSAHTTWDGGHGGEDRTLARITQNFYWPGITSDIDKFIHKCLRCQEVKGKRPSPAPLQNLPICESPNERVHIDLFGPLKSHNGNKYILVMTDAFTKMAELAAIEDKKADTVARAFFERWICRYSVPKTIVSDNGREFCNQVIDDLCKRMGIKHSTTSAYHPQSNSSAESYNRQMIKYLSSVLENNETLDWEEWLPMLMFSYNTHIHKATRHSPFFLTYLHDPRLPYFDIEKPRMLYGQDYVTHSWQIAQKCYSEAEKFLNTQAVKSKHYHDAKAKERSFELGQQVMLFSDQIPVNVNKKFFKKWRGPFVIIKKIGNLNLLLQEGPRTKKLLVHIDRVRHLSQSDFKESNCDSSALFDQTQVPHNSLQQELSAAGRVEAEKKARLEMEPQLYWHTEQHVTKETEQVPSESHQGQEMRLEEQIQRNDQKQNDQIAESGRLTRAKAKRENIAVPDLWSK